MFSLFCCLWTVSADEKQLWQTLPKEHLQMMSDLTYDVTVGDVFTRWGVLFEEPCSIFFCLCKACILVKNSGFLKFNSYNIFHENVLIILFYYKSHVPRYDSMMRQFSYGFTLQCLCLFFQKCFMNVAGLKPFLERNCPWSIVLSFFSWAMWIW